MDDFIGIIMCIKNPETCFKLCAIFMFVDVLTGYLKAFKLKKVNSSVSRDGYIKKIGWIIGLLLGWSVHFFLGTMMLLIGTSAVCVATEGISVYENLGEIGVKLPFNKYFIKLKEDVEDEL